MHIILQIRWEPSPKKAPQSPPWVVGTQNNDNHIVPMIYAVGQ
jgi:hypothetical protein